MREIPLTQGKVALVDDADYDKLIQYNWFAQRIRHHWYACRRGGRTYMHREILGLSPIEQCDHIDGNGLNNQRQNLRLSTATQNQGNRRKLTTETFSQYKGVSRYKRGNAKPWQSYITREHKTKHLGYFATEIEAAHVYDTAARVLFGPFARCNFAEELPPGQQEQHIQSAQVQLHLLLTV